MTTSKLPTDLPWSPSREHPGAFHRQSTWRERALNWERPLPLWLRLAFLAYADHKANGHATYSKDALRGELGTGEKQVYRALSDAIKYGYLADRSSLRCLVVPPEAVSGGMGHHNDPCAYCNGKAKRRKVSVTASY